MTSGSAAFDVIVLGAGPSGIMAAVAARRYGAAVAVLDENPAAGGQVYRMPHSASAARVETGADELNGARLRTLLASSGAALLFSHKVWSVAPGYRIDAIGPERPVTLNAPRVIVATGTVERVVPFPGSTLPGVIGLAAATILLKSQRMLPGRSTVVAGCGPLLVSVAAGIQKAGGKVVALVDTAGHADWLRRVPAMLARPDLLRRGAGWLRTLRAAGVPMLHRHAVVAVAPRGTDLEVTIGPVQADGSPGVGPIHRFIADCVTVGNGLTPSTEVSRVLRAQHRYEPARGGWIAVTDEFGQTSLPGLHVVGDGSGIAGAAAAEHHGELAGLAVAHEAGRLAAADFEQQSNAVRARFVKARRFGGAMAELMALRPGHVAAIPPDTIVCRCEDVTRADIERALDDGALEVNQLKAWTRCGMGPCQGRSCGDIVGELVARRTGSREAAGYFTGRLPLRPVSLAAVTGDYVYADIPIPKAAPL